MPRHLIVGTQRIAYPLGTHIIPPHGDWSQVRRLRCAMAYATQSGLGQLLRTFGWQADQQPPVRTEWIIGIHNGIREPGAISTALNWQNSRVRIFTPDGRVSRRSMLLIPRLHGKIIALDPRRGAGLFAEVAGSGNLTNAAIGAAPSNFEAGIVLTSQEIDLTEDRETFDRWWKEVWERSIIASTSLINRYARERGRFLRDTRRVIDVIELDQPDTTQIASARFLWIEAGDMSGGNEPRYRYQMEINRSLAQFFHPHPPFTEFAIQMPRDGLERASLTLRLQHHFVRLWRLSLPHPRRFALQYRRRVLRFERIAPQEYRLEVARIGSAAAVRWWNSSNREGHLGRTGTQVAPHGREWGYYG